MLKSSKLLKRLICMLMAVILLATTFALPASAASYSTGKYTVSHSKGVNVRKGAGTSYAVQGAAERGVSFDVTKVSGEWGYTKSIKTTSGNKSGWVSLNYCKKAPNTKITFSSVSAPNNGNVVLGKGYHLSGKIASSGSNISSIQGQVFNSSSKQVISKSVSVNTSSYNLKDSAIDNALTFGMLSTGSYTLKYTVKTKDGTSATKSLSFKVSKPATTVTPKPDTPANANTQSTSAPPATEIYVTQTPQHCTAAANAMLLKAYCYQKGDSYYKKITESTIINAPEMWSGGMRYDFKIRSINNKNLKGLYLNQYRLSGSAAVKQTKITALLRTHPEGVVLYGDNSQGMHAIYMGANGKILDPWYGNSKYLNLSQSANSCSDSWSDITDYWILENHPCD